MTARFLLKHYKLWVLREIVRGHSPRLQQTQIQSESLHKRRAHSGNLRGTPEESYEPIIGE